MFILKRILSIIGDILIALFPAIGANLSGQDILISFSIFYLLTQVVGIIIIKGQTIGMKLFQIRPMNISGKNINILKLFFYHIFLTIDIVTIFSSISATMSGILIGIVLIVPFSFRNRCQSLLDLIFSIYWVDVPKHNVVQK